MPIIARGSSKTAFEPCPEGVQQAVCCDVIDLGVQETPWGAKHKVDIRFQSAETMADDKPYLVTRKFTLSLHEKANLRAFLESWRGRTFTDEEVQGFDLERLLGANAMINVVHKPGSKGNVIFANIISIMPLPKGLPKIGVVDYERVVARVTEPEPDEQVPQDLTEDYEDVGF